MQTVLLYFVLFRLYHDDVIKWKHPPRYWPFVRGIHRASVDSPQKDQWRGTLIFSLICASTNGWANTWDAGDLRRHPAHYDVILMWSSFVNSRDVFFRVDWVGACEVICKGIDKVARYLITTHDDVIKWNHFPRYSPFVRGFHRSQRPVVTRSFDLRLNKLLNKQSRRRLFDTSSRSLWLYYNENMTKRGPYVKFLRTYSMLRSKSYLSILTIPEFYEKNLAIPYFIEQLYFTLLVGIIFGLGYKLILGDFSISVKC